MKLRTYGLPALVLAVALFGWILFLACPVAAQEAAPAPHIVRAEIDTAGIVNTPDSSGHLTTWVRFMAADSTMVIAERRVFDCAGHQWFRDAAVHYAPDPVTGFLAGTPSRIVNDPWKPEGAIEMMVCLHGPVTP